MSSLTAALPDRLLAEAIHLAGFTFEAAAGVVDADVDRHPALRPFAGVVEQIADHFFEVLALAKKAQTRIGAARKDHALVAIDFTEGAQQGLDRRRDLRRGAERAAARRRPRPVEIEGDLIAHDLRLFLNFPGELPGRGIGFIDDDGERRFQRMGEIADLRARAFENVAIGADQQIELFGERRDFARVGVHDPLAFAAADRRQFTLQLPQRPQAEANLEGGADGERNRERRESDDQRESKAGDLLFQVRCGERLADRNGAREKFPLDFRG